MGSWSFELSGVGAHHNRGVQDADRALQRAVCALRVAQSSVGPWSFKANGQEVELDVDPKGLDFSTALQLVKLSKRVRRTGWNGKGMWVRLLRAQGAEADGLPLQDCIVMRTADGKMQPGWLASQNDMLAEDWELVPECET